MNMRMRILAGPPVSGADFFRRDNEIELLWHKIDSGLNILVSAPRRVGKTSILYYVRDNPQQNLIIIYLITESINNENIYYKRLLDETVQAISLEKNNRLLAISKNAEYIIKDLMAKTKAISLDGVEFDTNSKLNYYNEFVKMLKALDLGNSRIIYMVDEFPQTLENIIKDENERSAVHFLETNRALRQDPIINKKAQFIYTGSIGLDGIVSRLNQSHLTNDLEPFKVGALQYEEAVRFIKELSNNLICTLSSEDIDYILREIKWYIPFNIQVIMSELNDITRRQNINEVNRDIIDQAFRQALENRNRWESWHTRLKNTYVDKREIAFIEEVLNHISEKDSIHKTDIVNYAVKYDISSYKDIIKTLKYDGYINNNEDEKIYIFNSPLLMRWWYKNVAN